MWTINFIIRITNELNLMIILKLLHFHFLLQTFIYYGVNLIAIHLSYCIESFYILKNKLFYSILTILL